MMIEMLNRAIVVNEKADSLAMTCCGLDTARELDHAVCVADNLCCDFVRRHGREMLEVLGQQRGELARLRQQLTATRLALVHYGAHDGACSVCDLDGDGRHCACDCGYEAAIKAAEDKTYNAELRGRPLAARPVD